MALLWRYHENKIIISISRFGIHIQEWSINQNIVKVYERPKV